MNVYDIANTLILERASRDEVHMALFTIMVDYFSGGDTRAKDFVEFRRITNIDYATYNNCLDAAKAEMQLTFA